MALILPKQDPNMSQIMSKLLNIKLYVSNGFSKLFRKRLDPSDQFEQGYCGNSKNMALTWPKHDPKFGPNH